MMQRHLALFLALCLCLGVPALAEEEAYSFVDDLDRTVQVTRPERVAALTGSLAELWMLAGGELACATRDAWEEGRLAADSPVVNAGSLKQPEAETLLQAGIDFAILTPTLSGQTALGQTLSDAGVTVAYFDMEDFSDYLRILKICTDITGDAQAYETYGTKVEAEVAQSIARAQGQPSPTVLLIRAYSSGVKAKGSADNMTGAMLRDLGCVNIADSDGGLLEDLSLEAIVAADPDYIFITTMGADDEALEQLAGTLESSPAWRGLSAVKAGRSVVLPKDLFHLKPNARWAESYAILADILYGAQ